MRRIPQRAEGRSAAGEKAGPSTRRGLNATRPHISAVLLAAGSSSRFGSIKQLAIIDSNATLVERAVAMLKRSKIDSIVVVLGNRSAEVRERLGNLGARVRVVVNPDFRRGLSTSLKAGIRASLEDSDAVVVALADQPLVTSQLIDKIISRYLVTRCAVVTASAGDLISPPALFDRSIYGDLLVLRGDVGAKPVIMKHKPFERVEVERDTLLDVDTKSDIEIAKEKLTLLEARPRSRNRKGPATGARARAHPSSR